MKSRSFPIIGICRVCARLFDECCCPEAERRKQQFKAKRKGLSGGQPAKTKKNQILLRDW